MEALWVSTGAVALAEMGDKTQLLAFILAVRFKPRFSIRRTVGAARSLPAHLGPFLPFFVAHSRAMGSSVRVKLTPNCARYRFAP